MTIQKKKKIGTVKGIRIGFVITLVAGMFALAMMPHPTIQETDDGRSWHVVWEGSLTDLVRAAEADPGAGKSGILSVYILNHSATPDTAYDENSSATLESWASAANLGYANADDANVDIAHSTDFDIVVRVRGNKTHCWDGSQFVDSYLRVRVSSSDLNLAADTEATGVVSYNDSGENYIWMNHYIDQDQGASNLNIARDETAEITSIKFEAYY